MDYDFKLTSDWIDSEYANFSLTVYENGGRRFVGEFVLDVEAFCIDFEIDEYERDVDNFINNIKLNKKDSYNIQVVSHNGEEGDISLLYKDGILEFEVTSHFNYYFNITHVDITQNLKRDFLMKIPKQLKLT